MDEFRIHNLHWESLPRFEQSDPQLSLLRELKYVARLDWWKNISTREGGIYIVTGGRQIGKSTSLKLFMRHLLSVPSIGKYPKAIFYLTCDQIADRRQLYDALQLFLNEIGNRFFYLFIDEITFVREWEKTIKGLADEGYFRRGICVITGSDQLVLEEAATALPGRRGQADRVDFIVHPLTFREFIDLVDPKLTTSWQQSLEALQNHFLRYFICGGFLRPINELYMNNNIRQSTYQTYQQWIVGDFIKRGKKREFLLEVLKAVLDTLGTQITFSELSRRCALLSKETFIDYLHLLIRMGALQVQDAFDQNTLGPFPKKAKKLIFSDPFILASVQKWLEKSPPVEDSVIVENIVASHYSRKYPTYYIKADGEVDIVIVENKKFTPIEVKWTRQVRPKDLKQIRKYPQSLILTQSLQKGILSDIPTIPVVEKLMEL